MMDCQDSVVVGLVAKARAGDQQSLERLFDTCRNYLNIIARSQVETSLRTKVDASDLVQQTLLEAHRDFDRFEGQSEQEWLAWLRRILLHNAHDFIRRYRFAKKRQAVREVRFANGGESDAGGAPEPEAPGETPSQQLIHVEEQRRVADAISQLSADHREVILLRNLQRLSFDEVAQRMDRSRPAAQMLWTRAIQKLQQLLETSCE